MVPWRTLRSKTLLTLIAGLVVLHFCLPIGIHAHIVINILTTQGPFPAHLDSLLLTDAADNIDLHLKQGFSGKSRQRQKEADGNNQDFLKRKLPFGKMVMEKIFYTLHMPANPFEIVKRCQL
jgi:hypothetical protein